MKVLVCGSRDWWEPGPIARELGKLPPGTIVVHGGARGADSLAGDIAAKLGFEVRVYPADWDKYGKGAGPVRNTQMIREEHLPGEPLDMVLAFSRDFVNSKGTKNMMMQAAKAGIFVDSFSV